MVSQPMRSYNAYSSTTSSQRNKSSFFEKQTNEIESQLSSEISSTISTHSPLFITSDYYCHTMGKSKNNCPSSIHDHSVDFSEINPPQLGEMLGNNLYINNHMLEGDSSDDDSCSTADADAVNDYLDTI